MNSYELSRAWFDFAFENPEKISPNHSAIYFFAIEHCNRLGWKTKFGFPTQMAMDAIGIKKHQTYIRYFNELVEWGFFILVQKSANQYSSNIISLISAMPKNGKAMDKANIIHAAKQIETNGQSNSSIDKQGTIKPLTKETIELPFKSELFVTQWKKLIVQPKWKKKSIDALIASLEILEVCSESDAIQMIKNSIAGNWQGVFPLDKKTLTPIEPKTTVKKL